MEAITDRPTMPDRATKHRSRHSVVSKPHIAVDECRLSSMVATTEQLMAAKRLAEARDLATAALQYPAAAAEPAARLRLTRSSILFTSGRPAEARAEAEDVLGTPHLPDELYVRAELGRLFGLMAEDQWAPARRAAEAVLGGGDRPGMDAALSGALTTLGVIAWREGRINHAIELVEAAVHRADIGPPEGRRSYPRLTLAGMLTATGAFDTARDAIDECRGEIERLGDGAWTAAPDVMLARLHLAEGHLDHALSGAETALALTQELGTPLFAPSAMVTLAAANIARGHPDQASRYIDDLGASPTLADVGAFGTATLRWVAGRLMARKAGAGTAIEVLSDVYNQLPTSPRLLIEEPAAAAWLVRTALTAGDRARAELVVACTELLAANNDDVKSVAATALHARGILDQDPVALLQAAADHRQPWAAASAFEDAGMVMYEGNQPDDARPVLQRALDRYVELTANHDAARVRGLLENSGAWRRRISRPVSGWESLTAGEKEVARLIALGLTNREAAERLCLSRHTVDFHLRSIYRKLAIRSRVELTRTVLERGESA